MLKLRAKLKFSKFNWNKRLHLIFLKTKWDNIIHKQNDDNYFCDNIKLFQKYWWHNKYIDNYWIKLENFSNNENLIKSFDNWNGISKKHKPINRILIFIGYLKRFEFLNNERKWIWNK